MKPSTPAPEVRGVREAGFREPMRTPGTPGTRSGSTTVTGANGLYLAISHREPYGHAGARPMALPEIQETERA